MRWTLVIHTRAASIYRTYSPPPACAYDLLVDKKLCLVVCVVFSQGESTREHRWRCEKVTANVIQRHGGREGNVRSKGFLAGIGCC